MSILDPNYGLDPLQMSMQQFAGQQQPQLPNLRPPMPSPQQAMNPGPTGNGIMSALQGNDPTALLMLASHLLANSGPPPRRTSFGQRLGTAVGGALPEILNQQSINERTALSKADLEHTKAQHQMELDRRMAVSNQSLAMLQSLDQNGDGVADDPTNQQLYEGLKVAILSGDSSAAMSAIRMGKPQGPSSSIGKLQSDLNAGLITPQQYQQQVEIMSRPLVQMGDKPIGDAAVHFRGPNNQVADPSWTYGEAAARGFRMVSDAAGNAADSAAALGPTLAAAMNFGFSPDGESLFPPADKGTASRLLSGAKAKWQQVTQDPQNPDLLLYNSTKEASLSGLARLVGQTGTLTEKDVGMVRNLWPTPGLTPEPVARRQFDQIVGLLRTKGVPDEQIKSFGFPNLDPPAQKTPGGVDYTVQP